MLFSRNQVVKMLCMLLATVVLLETYVPLVEAGEKGRDIIITDGKVIVKSGKKKGNIIISHGQGKYKYKKKYMDYGGYWRR